MTPFAHKILKSAVILAATGAAVAVIWVCLEKREEIPRRTAVTLCGSGLIFSVVLLLGIWRDEKPDA
jgi:hypothetical protein